MNVIANQYGVGEDNVGLPNRQRYHTDDSIEIMYYNKTRRPAMASTRWRLPLLAMRDAKPAPGVTCCGGKGGPRQDFLGWMAYNRWWWHKDLFAFTLGGGQMTTPVAI